MTNPTLKLDGKRVLVTGGNSGIGLGITREFHAQGARLAITGRDEAGLAAIRAELGGDVLALRSDSGQVAEIERLMAMLREHWGGLDVLVVNAAIAQPAPFEFVTEAQFDAMTSVNVKGVFFTIQKALPLLVPGASVIVMTSIANQMGSPNFSVYAAGKAALRSLVQTLGLELIGRGVRVNAIAPGPISTPMWDRFGLPDAALQAIQDDVRRKSPSQRFGRPDEIAKTALFLASDDSSYVVGQELAVDGGMCLL